MFIKRVKNGKITKYKLTKEELYEAHKEFVTNFMEQTLRNDFSLDLKTAKELAVLAYEKYCEGDGKTEYECIQAVYDDYMEELL